MEPTGLCIVHEIEALEDIECELVAALDTRHQRLHPRSRTGQHIRQALAVLDDVIDSLYADIEADCD